MIQDADNRTTFGKGKEGEHIISIAINIKELYTVQNYGWESS